MASSSHWSSTQLYEMAAMRFSASKSEAIVLNLKKCTALVEFGGKCCLLLKGLSKFYKIMFTIKGRMEYNIDRWVIQYSFHRIVYFVLVHYGEERSDLQNKSLRLPVVNVPDLIYSHKLCSHLTKQIVDTCSGNDFSLQSSLILL